MKSTVWRLSATAALALLLGVPAPAQKNQLQVNCVDQSEQPLSGIKVYAEDMISGKRKDEKCNRQGVASFRGLDDGVYRLYAREKEYQPRLYEYAILKGGAQETVTLAFQPGNHEQPFYFEDDSIRQRALALQTRGVELLQSNQFAEGAEQLEAALALNPSDLQAYYNLAVADLQLNRWERAEQALERAANLAQGAIEISAPQFEGQENPFVSFHQQIQKLQQDLTPMKLSSEANAALQAKNFEEAVASYQEALKLKPGDPNMLYNLALAQSHAGSYDEAIRTIDQALQINSNEQAFQDLKQNIQERKKRAALEEAQKVLAGADESYNSENYEAALKEYQTALGILSEDFKALVLVQIAKTHDQLNQPDQAARAYQQAIEMEPENTDYLEALADHYVKREEPEKAMQIFVDLYRKSSTPVAEELFDRAQRFAKTGKPKLARAAYEKVMEVRPDHAEALYELGMLYFYDLKDNAGAKQMLSRYLASGTEDQAHRDNAEAVLAVIEAQK